MTDEIELISDGDGLAVIGDPTAVERFLFCWRNLKGIGAAQATRLDVEHRVHGRSSRL